MKKYLFIFAGVLILLLVLFFLQSYIRQNLGVFAKTADLKIADKTFKLEIADDPKEREIGLSEKKSLADDEGMIFVFDTAGKYTFWMRDMDFPIDIIFLRENRIVQIYENVPAPKSDKEQNLALYSPSEPADRVIELKAGKAKELGLKTGQTLALEL